MCKLYGNVVENVIKMSMSIIHMRFLYLGIKLIESIKWQLKGRGTKQEYLA